MKMFAVHWDDDYSVSIMSLAELVRWYDANSDVVKRAERMEIGDHYTNLKLFIARLRDK